MSSFSIRNHLPFAFSTGKGIFGNVGPPGATGPQGATGIQGDQGLIGPTGSVGQLINVGSYTETILPFQSSTTGTIEFSSSFTNIPCIVSTPSIGTINISSRTLSNFSYILNTKNNNSPQYIDFNSVISDINLFLTNGNPSLLYKNNSDGAILYNRSDTSTGTWGGATGLGFTYNNPIANIINGNPAFTTYNSGTSILYYIYSTNSIGGGSWLRSTVSITGGVNSAPISANGNPALAFQNANTSALMYVRSNNVTGTSFPEPTVVDTGSPDVLKISIVDGNPAIMFSQYNAGLKFVRATDVNGTSWGSPVIVDPIINTFYQMSDIISVGGFPAIAYSNVFSKKVYFVRATNVSGSVWGDPVLVDSGNYDVTNNLTIPYIYIVEGVLIMFYNMRTVNNTFNRVYIRKSFDNGVTWSNREPFTEFDIGFGQSSKVITNGSGFYTMACPGSQTGGIFVTGASSTSAMITYEAIEIPP